MWGEINASYHICKYEASPISFKVDRCFPCKLLSLEANAGNNYKIISEVAKLHVHPANKEGYHSMVSTKSITQ